MKKAIDGLTYNTNTAEKIGSWDNGLFPSDIYYLSRTLYRRFDGLYFLHVAGGAATYFAKYRHGTYAPGEDITAMDDGEARRFAYKFFDIETAEKAFPNSRRPALVITLEGVDTLPAGLASYIDSWKRETGKNVTIKYMEV